MKRVPKGIVSILFVVGMIPCCALAHPHSWISLRSEFILDKNGHLTEIHQRWNFDIYYSMMTLADVVNEHRDQQKGLAIMAKTMAQNLAEYRYFSNLIVSGTDIPLPAPYTYALTTRMSEGQEILSLQMQFKLDKPQPMQGKSVTWSVFDPTYFIDISHGKPSEIAILNQGVSHSVRCLKTIEVSEPSEEVLEYAASLDRTQKDTQGLGNYFAEKVLITC